MNLDICKRYTLRKKNGAHLNIMEGFYFHEEASFDNHFSAKYTIFLNMIFYTILKNENF